MKILPDTNILISASLYPNSKPAMALFHAGENHALVLTDYNNYGKHAADYERYAVIAVTSIYGVDILRKNILINWSKRELFHVF